jgi:hypothetical protein
VVLQKTGEDQFDKLREKWSITQNQGGKKYHAYNKTKVGYLVGVGTAFWYMLLKGRYKGKRRGRRHTQLLDDTKETRRHWILMKQALAHTVCRTSFGKSYQHSYDTLRGEDDITRIKWKSLYNAVWTRTIIPCVLHVEWWIDLCQNFFWLRGMIGRPMYAEDSGRCAGQSVFRRSGRTIATWRTFVWRLP